MRGASASFSSVTANPKESQPIARSSNPNLPRRRALNTRWQSLAGVALFVSAVNTTYAYGIFSALLRTYLGYSQDELDLIASIGNNGLYLSLVAGLLIERIGFKRVVRLGALLIFIGFVYIWLAVKEHISSSLSTISFFYFLSQLGVCFHITSAITVAVKLFPHTSHGGAIGLAKGYFGMSSAVLGDIAGGVFSNYPAGYLLFVAIFIPIISNIGVHYANLLPPHLLDLNYEAQRGMYRSLDPFFMHWCVLFLTLTLVGYYEYAYTLSFFQEVVTSVMIAIVLGSLLYIPQMYGQTNIPVEDCVAYQTVGQWDLEEDGAAGGAEERQGGADTDVSNVVTAAGEHTSALWATEAFGARSPGPRLFSQFLPNSGSNNNNNNSNDSGPRLSTRINCSNLHHTDDEHHTDGTANNNNDEVVVDDGDDEDNDDDVGNEEASLLSQQRLQQHQPRHYQRSDNNSNSNSNTYSSFGGKVSRTPSYTSHAHYGSTAASDTASQASLSLSACFYGESLPLSEAVRTWRMWCLFAMYLVSCGAGLLVIYNVYAIAEAVNQEATSFFVTFIALTNGLGRVVAGGMSDLVVQHDLVCFSRPISKLQLLAIVILCMAIVQALLSLGFSTLLFPCLLAVGFLFGTIVSLMAINVADIFGEKYIATNFGCVDAAPIFGSYLFATYLVSIFYSTNSTVENDNAYYSSSTTSDSCSGASCFRGAFLITAVCCVFGSALGFFLDHYTPR